MEGVTVVDISRTPEKPWLVRITVEETIVPLRTAKLLGVALIEKSGTMVIARRMLWDRDPDVAVIATV